MTQPVYLDRLRKLREATHDYDLHSCMDFEHAMYLQAPALFDEIESLRKANPEPGKLWVGPRLVDVPVLLSEIEALRAEVERLTEDNQYWRKTYSDLSTAVHLDVKGPKRGDHHPVTK